LHGKVGLSAKNQLGIFYDDPLGAQGNPLKFNWLDAKAIWRALQGALTRAAEAKRIDEL